MRCKEQLCDFLNKHQLIIGGPSNFLTKNIFNLYLTESQMS